MESTVIYLVYHRSYIQGTDKFVTSVYKAFRNPLKAEECERDMNNKLIEILNTPKLADMYDVRDIYFVKETLFDEEA